MIAHRQGRREYCRLPFESPDLVCVCVCVCVCVVHIGVIVIILLWKHFRNTAGHMQSILRVFLSGSAIVCHLHAYKPVVVLPELWKYWSG